MDTSSRHLTAVEQTPLVSVFKLCGVERWENASRTGDVRTELDRTIGKHVVSIRGNISACNNVRLPRSGDTLRLLGGFVYLEVLHRAKHIGTVHLDIITKQKTPFRITICTLYAEPALVGSCLRLPWPSPGEMARRSTTWAVFRVDVRRSLAALAPSVGGYSHLEAVTLGAMMKVRDVFTSDNFYDKDHFPEHFSRSHAKHHLDWRDVPHKVFDASRHADAEEDLPLAPTDQTSVEAPPMTNSSKVQGATGGVEKVSEGVRKSVEGVDRVAEKIIESSETPPYASATSIEVLVNGVESAFEMGDSELSSPGKIEVRESDEIQKENGANNLFSSIRESQEIHRLSAEESIVPEAPTLSSSPVLTLDRAIGFGMDSGAKWVDEQHCAFCAGSLVVLQAVPEGSEEKGAKQVFLRGHSAPVCVLEVSADRKKMATARPTAS